MNSSFVSDLMLIYLPHLHILDQTLASPEIFLQPSGPDQNTVGQRQDVICSISVPPDVDPDTIELGWLNEDDIITDDSRVTITESMHDSANNVITAAIQFDPLYEEDEGIYTCYAIVNESESFRSIQLQNFKSMLCIYTYVYVYTCIYVPCSTYSLCIHHCV